MTAGWEEQFAEENHHIRQRMATSSFEEIREALQKLEQRTAAGLTDEAEKCRVKHSAAKWLLYAAIDMRRSFEECRSLLEAVIQLGFASPQDRVTTIAVFARHCLQIGRKGDGYQYFQPAIQQLENAPGVVASAPAELVAGYRRLLEQLAP
jgi:hypothetical protein